MRRIILCSVFTILFLMPLTALKIEYVLDFRLSNGYELMESFCYFVCVKSLLMAKVFENRREVAF